MASARVIIRGMAARLWDQASDPGARRPRASTPPPPAAMTAAMGLAELYEDANEDVLPSLFSKLRDVEDPDRGLYMNEYAGFSFGSLLVALATTPDAKREWSKALGGLLVIPSFEITYKRGELKWSGESPSHRKNPRSPHEVEHTKTVAEVRQILAGPSPKNARKCTPRCSGWDVFDTERGLEIEACDDCNRLRAPALRLSDDDVAQLPEAQKALREAAAAELEENPAGRFTEKGERMYEDVKATYAGDPRAEEIAARTVYARAADGVPGLLVRHGRPPGVPNGRRR